MRQRLREWDVYANGRWLGCVYARNESDAINAALSRWLDRVPKNADVHASER